MTNVTTAELRLIYTALRYYQRSSDRDRGECEQILKKITPSLNLYGNRPPCD